MTGTLFDAPVAGVSRGEMIRRAVKSAIIGGSLQPGDKVTIAELVAQSGSTIATVAPVMHALVDEGFLTRTGRDATVTIVTPTQGVQAVETLQLIAAAITPTGSESGRMLLEYIAAVTGTRDTSMFRAAREAFARAAAECPNPTLAKTLTTCVDGLLWRAGHAPTPEQLDTSAAPVAGSPW